MKLQVPAPRSVISTMLVAVSVLMAVVVGLVLAAVDVCSGRRSLRVARCLVQSCTMAIEAMLWCWAEAALFHHSKHCYNSATVEAAEASGAQRPVFHCCSAAATMTIDQRGVTS